MPQSTHPERIDITLEVFGLEETHELQYRSCVFHFLLFPRHASCCYLCNSVKWLTLIFSNKCIAKKLIFPHKRKACWKMDRVPHVVAAYFACMYGMDRHWLCARLCHYVACSAFLVAWPSYTIAFPRKIAVIVCLLCGEWWIKWSQFYSAKPMQLVAQTRFKQHNGHYWSMHHTFWQAKYEGPWQRETWA